MIDCSKTENYFAEKRRMTKMKKRGLCETECSKCPLGCDNNGKGEDCSALEMLYFKEAIAIVQKWSDENPKETFLTELLKNYPNVKLRCEGVPDKNLCPYQLGLMNERGCEKYKNCVACWNQPIPSKE